MVDLTISIDQTDLSLDPLVLSGVTDANTWGILPGFTMPGLVARNVEAESPFLHGSVVVRSTWQKAFFNLDVFPRVTTGAELATAYGELVAASGQFSYDATVTLNGVASVWRCDCASISPSPLDYPELVTNAPVYSLSIPVYPIAS